MPNKDRIPFNAWSEERILQGRKFCTSRHKKYVYDARVLAITRLMPWGVIKTYLFDLEGADSPAELQQVVEEIYHRQVKDDEVFYVHFGNFGGVDSEKAKDSQAPGSGVGKKVLLEE